MAGGTGGNASSGDRDVPGVFAGGLMIGESFGSLRISDFDPDMITRRGTGWTVGIEAADGLATGLTDCAVPVLGVDDGTMAPDFELYKMAFRWESVSTPC